MRIHPRLTLARLKPHFLSQQHCPKPGELGANEVATARARRATIIMLFSQGRLYALICPLLMLIHNFQNGLAIHLHFLFYPGRTIVKRIVSLEGTYLSNISHALMANEFINTIMMVYKGLSDNRVNSGVKLEQKSWALSKDIVSGFYWV